MKDCVRFVTMIGAREGELGADEAKAFEAHLATCATCRALARDATLTDGLVAEALLARANERDFAPFVDEVMARIGAAPQRRGLAAWIARHRRALVASLVPALAAVAVIVYVRIEGGGRPEQYALLEVASEGDATTILQTSDGPIVLLNEGNGS